MSRKNCDTCKFGDDKSILANSPVWCRIDDRYHRAGDVCDKWVEVTKKDLENQQDSVMRGRRR